MLPVGGLMSSNWKSPKGVKLNINMKVVKRLIGFFVFLLVALLIAAIAVPFLYKDRIVEMVKDEANKTLNAKMDFQEVDISLFRSFPDLNVQLENVTIDGIGEFDGVRLFEGEAVEVEMNVVDAYAAKDNFPVKSVLFQRPVVNILVLKNGKANWDIMKPSEGESSDYLVKMKQYVVENGDFTYVDKGMDFQMALKDINHTGGGAFSSDDFDLVTKTHIADASATLEGIDYLTNAKADLDAIIHMNIPDQKFTLKDNELLLNALKINTEGTFDINKDHYVMDLNFRSPQGDFKSLWSLIPGVFTADFANAAILGKMGFKGFVKGTYNPTIPRYPTFQIKADVDNGQVQYPDLPVGVTGIFTNVLVNSPSSDFDRVVVDILQFKMKVGDNPVNGAFNLKTPVSDPTVKGQLKGTIDLGELGRAVPIEGITKLNGTIQSDVVFDASQSQLDNKQYDQANIAGQVNMQNVAIEQTGTPPISINQLQADFSPQRVKVETFNGQLGESDIQATGQIDNILAYFSPEKTMEGKVNFTSNYVNANEWMSEDTTATVPSTAVVEKPFDRFNMDVTGTIQKMDYSTYELTDMNMKGVISPNESDITAFSTNIGESDIQASGKVNNLMDYVLENEVLTGEIKLKSDFLDLNQFMVEETSSETNQAMEVIPVPENVDLTIHSNLKKVRYTNFDLNNIKGDVVVKEEKAEMKDVVGKVLGGLVKFDGAYDTRDLSAPKFSLAYQLDKLDVNNAFKTFNTFRAIAPLARYVDGKFTTNLKMDGVLGKDLIPDLSSLNLSGFLHTFGATLHHLLQEDMFYLIEANIPKKYLNKSMAGRAANEGWGLLVKEASKRGIDIDNGENVKLNINVTGSMLNPAFKIIPVGTDGSVTFEDKANEIVKATVDKVKDSIKTTATTAVDSVKTIVEEKVETVKDTVTTIVKEEADKVISKTKTKAGELLDSVLVKNIPILDSLKLKDSTKVTDKVKDILKDFNPFKKKKKGGN